MRLERRFRTLLGWLPPHIDFVDFVLSKTFKPAPKLALHRCPLICPVLQNREPVEIGGNSRGTCLKDDCLVSAEHAGEEPVLKDDVVSSGLMAAASIPGWIVRGKNEHRRVDSGSELQEGLKCVLA